MTTDDIRTARPQETDHRHAAAPHAHGHAHAHRHVGSMSPQTETRFTPGFSALRTSLQVRLGVALVASLLIWAAFYGAMQ